MDKIKKVKEKLWKFGYSVKDYTIIEACDFSFDLLVDKKIRVKVGEKEPEIITNATFDVFAKVEEDKITFITTTEASKSPYQAFGRPNK